jgi:putative lipoprotein
MAERTHRPLQWLGLLLALSGCSPSNVVPETPGGGALPQVTGTVAYRERIALPPTAVVTVRLVDVSRADAPSPVLAEQTIPTAGRQVPLSFALGYNPAAIVPAHTYAIQVRIENAGQLLFISDTHHPVITRDQPRHVDVIVRRVAAPQATPTQP